VMLIIDSGCEWKKGVDFLQYLQEYALLLLLLLLLFTEIEFSHGGSSPYTSTDKTNKNKYTLTRQYTNTVNTSTHITETPTHPHITKPTHTHAPTHRYTRP
jgi:hypothetical protein